MPPAEVPLAAAVQRTCPSCGQPVPANAVLCVACGYDFRTGKRLSTAFDAGGDED